MQVQKPVNKYFTTKSLKTSAIFVSFISIPLHFKINPGYFSETIDTTSIAHYDNRKYII